MRAPYISRKVKLCVLITLFLFAYQTLLFSAPLMVNTASLATLVDRGISVPAARQIHSHNYDLEEHIEWYRALSVYRNGMLL